MSNGLWILGGYQTDFARNYTREGNDISVLVDEVVEHTLSDAGVSASNIDVIHVGNAFGQLFTGQGHLGAMPATVHPELWGTPSSRHEAACASGSIATNAAMADLEAGRYECALVLGAELEKTVHGDIAAQHLGAAAWIGHEGQDATYMWPHMFSELADEYDRRYGLNDQHLHAISEMNYRNARSNPNAQTRKWQFGSGSFDDDDANNPVIEGRTRRNDCSQVTDGGAGVVIATDAWVAKHPEVLTRGRAARIAGWGHRTVGLSTQSKLNGDDALVLPHVAETFDDALRRAGLDSVTELDGIETHDCFAMSEYMAIDHLGITEPGKSWQAIEDGRLEKDGEIPVNPSGGLIGGGHPVGATGVRMLVDASRQVTGRAGEYQIPDARRFATLNIGGSTATTCSFVVESAEA